MPAEKYELRLSFPRLLIGLLVTVIPISLAGLYSIAQSDRALERTIGTQFGVIAESSAAQVADFVHDRLSNVGFLAVQPTIIDVVNAANRSYAGLSEQAVSDRIQKTEAAWNAAATQPVVDGMLGNPASQAVRRLREHDPRFLRVTVTDERGAFAAGTHKSLDYFQADEDFWQAIYAQGRGAVNITDVRYDEVTKSYYIGIGVPVLDSATHRFIGAVDALVDISSFFPLVNRAQLGPSARSLIVKDDGTLIAGPNANLAMALKSQEYAALADGGRTVLGQKGGYLVAAFRGGNRSVIAYADTGLKKDYGNLGWVVLVVQDADEAFAAVRIAVRLLALMSLIGLAAVTILTMYFVLHRHRPVTEIESLAHDYGKPKEATP